MYAIHTYCIIRNIVLHLIYHLIIGPTGRLRAAVGEICQQDRRIEQCQDSAQ